MTYNTPQRCELCDGEFKRPNYYKLPNHHIVCVGCARTVLMTAINAKELREESQ